MTGRSRKKRLINFVFSLNGFLFLLGGTGLINDGKLTIGIFQIIAGLINIAMLSSSMKGQVKRFFSGLILFMNVVVAGSIAYDYQTTGAHYIQYAWLVAAIFSLVAFVIYIKQN